MASVSINVGSLTAIGNLLAPIFSAIGDQTFDADVASNVDIKPFVTGSVDTWTLNGSPTGFTLSTDGVLSYDGLQAVTTIPGVSISATNAAGTATSTVFSLILTGDTTFTVPNITFERGVASNYDLSQHYSLPQGVSVASYANDGTALPASVTLDAVNEQMVYDGNGDNDVTVSGVILRVTGDDETVTAESDWIARSTGAGVVWSHDFRSDAEVDNYRWVSGTGNDTTDSAAPGRVVRNTSDGITGGGCLELIHPVGSGGNASWWRPFGPMSAASTGKAANDPADGGTMPLVDWDPTNASENEQYFESYYANQSFIDAGPASRFDGTEFYLQFRIKIDPNRYASGNPSAGKQSFLSTTQSTPNQEIVQMNNIAQFASWYTNFGSSPDTGGALGGPAAYQLQAGGDYDACRTNTGAGCWLYTPDEWVTFLYHLVPGTDDNRDTLFEVFVARQGETTYQTLFTQLITINFNALTSPHESGWNAFQPSNFMNGVAAAVAWYQRYDQIIFSKQFIPCPQK